MDYLPEVAGVAAGCMYAISCNSINANVPSTFKADSDWPCNSINSPMTIWMLPVAGWIGGKCVHWLIGRKLVPFAQQSRLRLVALSIPLGVVLTLALSYFSIGVSLVHQVVSWRHPYSIIVEEGLGLMPLAWSFSALRALANS